MRLFLALLFCAQSASAGVVVAARLPGSSALPSAPLFSPVAPLAAPLSVFAPRALNSAAALPVPVAASPVLPSAVARPAAEPLRAVAAAQSRAVAPRFAPAASAAAVAGKALAAPLLAPSARAFNGVFDGAKTERRGDDPKVRSSVRLVKTFLGPLLRAIYPTKVVGADNIPKTGGVLLIGNHPSYFDPVLTGLAADRPVRFLMYKNYYESPLKGRLSFLNPLVSRFLKAVGAIPLAPLEPGNGPKEILRSLTAAREALKRGEVVGLFPEGHVTRDGAMDEFMRGFAVIARGTDAAIIPFGLRGPWGSILSFGSKRSWLSRLFFRRSMTVTFGEPLETRDPAKAREVVAALASK